MTPEMAGITSSAIHYLNFEQYHLFELELLVKLPVTKSISGVSTEARLKVIVNLPPIFSFDKAVNPLQLEQLPYLVRIHLQKWLLGFFQSKSPVIEIIISKLHAHRLLSGG